MKCCLCNDSAKYEHMYKWYCKECIKKVTIRAETWSRVVGYLSPHRRWNKGKLQEWKEREFYAIEPIEESKGESMIKA